MSETDEIPVVDTPARDSVEQEDGPPVSRGEYAALVEMVEQMNHELHELREQVERQGNHLTKMNNKLNERIGESGDVPEEYGDWRDRRVLASLEDGDVTTRGEMVKRYELGVGMTNSDRIKERVKRLLDTDRFERDGEKFIYHE